MNCTHCALPVPRAAIEPGSVAQFCCQGCRTVHDFLRAHGLERFYELQADAPGPRAPAHTTGGGYEHVDHPAFREHHVSRTLDGLAWVELCLEGLRCAACVWVVERLPALQAGVVEARVDLGRRTVRIAWDDRRVALSRIARLLDSLGYPSHPARDSDRVEQQHREHRRLLVRIAVAGAIAGNVMVMSFALFGGMFTPMAREFDALFRWTSLGLAIVSLLGPGREFLRGALAALRTRTAHMDLPVAIGLVAGVAWGAANTIRGVGHTYFESLTAVIFLLLVGRYLVYRRQRAAEDAVELLFRVAPATARRIEDGAVREVPLEALACGDRVEVRAGDSVPADGTVVDGCSRFDLSLLTGESAPREVGPGQRVWAGTHNAGGRVEVLVEATGTATRAGRLMELVERFARERPPVVRIADRIAHRFVLAVLGLAVVTAAAWWSIDPERALEHSIALLIVTCPCALGLATPLAVVAAIGQAARRGILVKGGAALEALAAPGCILLDKTGTLTCGSTRLVAWEGEPDVLPLVVAAELQVAHPIARALVLGLRADAGELPSVQVAAVPGRGLEVRAPGREITIGSPAWIAERIGAIPAPALRTIEAVTARGATPVVVASGGRVVGCAGVGDPVHADATPAIAALRRLGFAVRVLSGDDPRAATAVAREVGIPSRSVEGGASPERKVDVVRRARADGGCVIMVGDGVNDAAALAAADVGVAVGGGAEASLAAADVYLREPGLGPLVELVRGARRTMHVIRRNMRVSLVYNLIAAGLAVSGRIDPLLASILMPLSSLSVVTLSYRSRTFAPSETGV